MGVGALLALTGLVIIAMNLVLGPSTASRAVLSRQAIAIVDEAIATTPAGAIHVQGRNSLQRQDGRVAWTVGEFVLEATPEAAAALRARVAELADGLQLRVADDREYEQNGTTVRQWAVREDGVALVQVIVQLETEATDVGAAPAGAEGAPAIGMAPRPPRRQPIRPCPPLVAIIIDDVGYVWPNAKAFLAFDRRLTLSVFPLLPRSTQFARLAHEHGREIMMHLPMESNSDRVNPGTLRTDMSEAELATVWEDAYASVPGIVGVNNHQGSVMTADPVAMEQILVRLQAQHLYFIDSRTTTQTVARKTAERLGMRTSENDRFLDNVKDVEYIKGKCRELLSIALVKGEAIGIAHCHPVTLQALQEVLPEFDAAGVQLVYASSLAD